MVCCYNGKLFAAAKEERIDIYEQSTNFLFNGRSERHIDFGYGLRRKHVQPLSQRDRCRLQISRVRFRIGIVRVHQQRHQGDFGNRLAHQFQPLGSQDVHEISHAGDIAARPA